MKIAILSESGNVGKTTLHKILAHAMPNYKTVAVETINANAGDEGEQVPAAQFQKLQQMLLTESNLLIDIGASNIELFFSRLDQYKGAATDIDMYIVPTVPALKQQQDAVKTILMLNMVLGVPKENIRIFFNQLPVDFSVKDVSSLAQIYSTVFQAHKEHKVFMLDGFYIRQNDVFDMMRENGASLENILAIDANALKAEILGLPESERIAASIKVMAHRLLQSVLLEASPLVELIESESIEKSKPLKVVGSK